MDRNYINITTTPSRLFGIWRLALCFVLKKKMIDDQLLYYMKIFVRFVVWFNNLSYFCHRIANKTQVWVALQILIGYKISVQLSSLVSETWKISIDKVVLATRRKIR